MLDGGTVLVWEWQDEEHSWKPYSPQVACYIEFVIRETPRATSVSLGEADASLTPYILDLISMNQFRLDTGNLFPVRRVGFPLSSAPGQGVTWEKEDIPGQWVPFETKLSVLIQWALERQQPGVCLGHPCSGSHICFHTMTQLDFPSHKRIRVRVRVHPPYPTATTRSETNDARSGQPNYLVIMNAKSASCIPSNGLTNSSHGSVNLRNGLINSNHEQINSNYGLMNSNYDIENSKHKLINNNNGVMSSKYGPTNNSVVLNSASVLMNGGHMLMNDEHRQINEKNKWPYTKSELVRSDCRPVESGHRTVKSVFGTSTSQPSLNSSDSRLADIRSVFIRSDSRIDDPSIQLARCDSRTDHHRPGLIRSSSRHADSSPGLVVSDPKHIDPNAGLVQSDLTHTDSTIKILGSSKSSDYRLGLFTDHFKPAQFKVGLTGKGLFQSTSTSSSRSPAHCSCPQCILVQSVKSSQWPEHKLERKAAGRPKPDSQIRESERGNIRHPANNSSDILEGSCL